MTLVQCKLGAVSPTVMGDTYAFTKDRYGRFVADVHHPKHLEMFLAVEHYALAEDIPSHALLAAAPVLSLDELRAQLESSVAPQIISHPFDGGTVYFVKDPWPKFAPVSNFMLEDAAEHPWLTVDGEKLFIDVANGSATYERRGTVPELGHLYELAGEGKWEAIPAEVFQDAPPPPPTPPDASAGADAGSGAEGDAPADDDAEPATTEPDPAADEVLKGSDKLDASYDFAGQTVLAATIVANAFAATGATRDEWNGLSQEDRDTFLQDELDRLLKASTTPPATPPAEPPATPPSEPAAAAPARKRRPRKAAASKE